MRFSTCRDEKNQYVPNEIQTTCFSVFNVNLRGYAHFSIMSKWFTRSDRRLGGKLTKIFDQHLRPQVRGETTKIFDKSFLQISPLTCGVKWLNRKNSPRDPRRMAFFFFAVQAQILLKSMKNRWFVAPFKFVEHILAFLISRC